MSGFIEVIGVGKHFGDFVALKGIDLAIRKGEFLTLLGPSGSGKTTLLNILAGFELPTSGRILRDGQDITEVPPEQRGFGMVFQGYALFPHMTVRQNIKFSLRVRGRSKDEQQRRADEMLALVDLTAHSDKLPSQLSGGQCQRVALARSLAFEPDVLLLDEPLSALDKNLRENLRSELTAIQRRTGTTFVFVTHDQEEALSMSDRIVIFDHGRMEQVGTPEELYDSPQSRFVAQFLGRINLLETTGRHDSGPGQVTASFGGETIRAPSDDAAHKPGYILCVRPEAIAVTAKQPAGNVNALPAILTERVFQGGRFELAARLPDGQIIRAEESREAPCRDFSTGQDIWVSWPPAHGRFLPAEPKTTQQETDT